MGRLDEAADVLRKARSLLPGNTDIALQFALCLHKRGELAAARAELERILASNPASANLWFAYGLVCQDSHDPMAAITAYRRTLDLSPELAEAHVNLGICLQQTGDIAAAKASLRPRDEASLRYVRAHRAGASLQRRAVNCGSTPSG